MPRTSSYSQLATFNNRSKTDCQNGLSQLLKNNKQIISYHPRERQRSTVEGVPYCGEGELSSVQCGIPSVPEDLKYCVGCSVLKGRGVISTVQMFSTKNNNIKRHLYCAIYPYGSKAHYIIHMKLIR